VRFFVLISLFLYTADRSFSRFFHSPVLHLTFSSSPRTALSLFDSTTSFDTSSARLLVSPHRVSELKSKTVDALPDGESTLRSIGGSVRLPFSAAPSFLLLPPETDLFLPLQN
jgi:hypothetical protein